MSRIRLAGVAAVASSFVLATLMSGSATAQAPNLTPPLPSGGGFVSKTVLVSPLTGIEDREVVLVSVTLEPGASSPPHVHPGDCYGSVLEGTIDLRVAGKELRRVPAGESYAVLNSPVHQFTNVGDKPARLLNTLVVAKGKPRAITQPGPVK